LCYTHTHPFNSLFSVTTQVSRYQKGKTNLDFTEARDSEWQWHHLGHVQVCTLLQTNSHASTPPLIFLHAGCSSCCPTNSVKALKEHNYKWQCEVNSIKSRCIAVRSVTLPHRYWILELTCYMGSHSVTCHPTGDIPAFTPAKADT